MAEHHTSGLGLLRVIFRLRVPDADQDRFLDAYRRIRHQVSQVEGYLGDQLCQSEGDPEDWVITSEWASAAHFHAWERGADHRRLAAPLVACATARESSRYHIRLTTTPGAEADRLLLEAKS
ncbi:antibiotic biosynthesis monooxygenase family protein [Lentzea sp.]|uniref:antibiotic biosynthesis monooxygenase family protein n=1 Tax=Lentzea sp. TaxID=56099 RepID=UPI002B9BA513|nr:antibiotic biosynthesis monooxygenase family protein [Lentzea sp.]HUQ61443.1 antibiotic biosynthesis monooxygenase family protein [Lentzea sp.]